MKKILLIGMLGLTVFSCKNDEKEAQARAQQATIDSLKMEAWRQHVADSIAQAQQLQQQQVSYESNVSTPRTYYGHSPRRSTTTRSTSTSTPSQSTTSTTTTTTQKKGWSAKAKGAVIGAGAGAVTGAMIDKRKGEGAIIGGILGAGAGLGTGAIIDAEQKKKAERERQAQQQQR